MAKRQLAPAPTGRKVNRKVRVGSGVKMYSRKIHFFHYDIQTYNPDSGSFERIANIADLFRYVMTLPCKHDVQPNRYLQTRFGDDYAVFVDTVAADRIEGRMALVRRGLLPDIERDGVITPLTIDETSGLAEISHFVLYLDKPVMGVEFNFYGPRANRLGWYMMTKMTTIVRIFEITPYLREDELERIRALHDVTWMTLGVHRDHVDVVDDLNKGWANAFRVLKSEDPAAERLEIRLVAEKSSQGLDTSSLLKVPELKKKPEFLQAFENITVNGTIQDRKEAFDLLEDRLVGMRKIMALNKSSRSVEKVAAYAAIRDAYEELKVHLKQVFDE